MLNISVHYIFFRTHMKTSYSQMFSSQMLLRSYSVAPILKVKWKVDATPGIHRFYVIKIMFSRYMNYHSHSHFHPSSIKAVAYCALLDAMTISSLYLSG